MISGLNESWLLPKGRVSRSVKTVSQKTKESDREGYSVSTSDLHPRCTWEHTLPPTYRVYTTHFIVGVSGANLTVSIGFILQKKGQRTPSSVARGHRPL